MSNKIEINVSDFVEELIEMKKRDDKKKEEETRKESEETISAYAAVLGWYSKEDGVIDVERCKVGLIELVKEYRELERLSYKDYERRCMYNTGRGRPVDASYFMSEEKIGDLLTRFDVSGHERARKVVVAYELMEKTFENFNKFVEGLWMEYAQEQGKEGQDKIREWQLRKEQHDKEYEKEIQEKLEKALEGELLKIQSTEEGKRKRTVPKDRTREIENQIKIENRKEKFTEERPEVEVVNFDRRIEEGRLKISELREAVGRLK